MNELQEEFGAKGLTIIGVTNEGKKETEAWIESKGAKYAYAYDKGGKFQSQLGVNGIPHAFLVDPTGKVVWEGHPGNLSAATIEKALDGALLKPMWEWPASAKDVKSALAKRKYADALAATAKVTEADMGPAIKTAIQGLVTSRVKSMTTALEQKNFLVASESASSLKDELVGLPEVAEAKRVEEAVKADKTAPDIIKAQKVIRDLRAQRLGKKKEREKALSDAEKIIKDLPGTVAETEAKAFLEELRKKAKAN